MKITNKSKFWAQHIKAQSVSRQTQHAYCDDHELNIHTFHFWKRRLSGKREVKNQKSRKLNSEQFIPIQLSGAEKPEESKTPLIKLELNEDMELSFSFKAKLAHLHNSNK